MAEPDHDPRVLGAYRELGDEAPPPALDAAILAASRRRGLRWQAPFAAAAALVLAVGVALVVQREDVEKKEEVALAPQVITARESQADLAKKNEPAPAAVRAPASPPAARQRMADAGKRTEQALASAPAAGRSAAEPTENGAPAVAGAMLESRAKADTETPERWLERIAKLREAGRHKEADESLAEFRRRHPDYRIPEEMRARVRAR